MHLITSLLALLPVAYAQFNGTNGIGSTPSQRNYISSERALKIITSAMVNATALNIRQNITVVDPSGMLPGAPLYGADNSNGGLVVFGGGLPIYLGGKLIGAVGVSGGSVLQDIQVA
ncbi:hypothetical protein BDU57DRAFT_557028 [Ampelomyces quisqualis]|uniref:DUF336-domain-containing protein n=1 Tax=Ampelomyces quisqualis TaxID=50730 RepID=A0A6A5QQE2_AMPQU|nr:hypothetical protein BDU57DRAFT_557028 [Ampelomyces quisqualis]